MSDPRNQFTYSDQQSLQLRRYPFMPKQNLQAWDAADSYLLNSVASEIKGQPLVVNDSFGALCCALAQHQPINISDSWIAQQACKTNAELNHIAATAIEYRSSLEWPEAEAHNELSWVLIKIPKSLALLEDQLHRLRPLLHSGSRIVAAAMTKHIHKSTLQLFEKIIGPCTTSLAVKKARLVFAEFDPELAPSQSPYPSQYPLAEQGLQMQDHAGVFSQGKLDIGSRFFIEHIPAGNKAKTIIDLGCGNGLLGIVAAAKNPQAEIVFCDESFMATATAELNWQQNIGREQSCRAANGDCLSPLKDQSADLILNNPPFHQGNVVGDFIAQQMFNDAKRVLKPGGELWVVGNRHLGYHKSLKRLFGHCETIAGNSKFVVLKAVLTSS